MNITSTAELRRVEAEPITAARKTWVWRFGSLWQSLADIFSPRLDQRQPQGEHIEPIMSMGDD